MNHADILSDGFRKAVAQTLTAKVLAELELVAARGVDMSDEDPATVQPSDAEDFECRR